MNPNRPEGATSDYWVLSDSDLEFSINAVRRAIETNEPTGLFGFGDGAVDRLRTLTALRREQLRRLTTEGAS